MAKLTVILLGNELVTQNEDDKAAEAITPGHLVAWNGSGDLVKHAGAAGVSGAMFALEREELGQDMNAPYAIGDTVKVGLCPTGVRVNSIIASGQNVTKGAFLESAGNGTLKVGTTNPIGQALEAVNATATARLRVQII
jgi:hypothetical protein